MKIGPMIALFLWATAVLAAPVDQDGNVVLTAEQQACSKKVGILDYAVAHRHEETEEEMLKQWKFEFEVHRAHGVFDSYATFVDGQRLIRDAHRKNKQGEYRLKNDEETLMRHFREEAVACMRFGF